jgi:hypothetical protein
MMVASERVTLIDVVLWAEAAGKPMMAGTSQEQSFWRISASRSLA